MRRAAITVLSTGLLLIMLVSSFNMLPIRVHATTTTKTLLQDDFESYFCPPNPLSLLSPLNPFNPWVLRFGGANYGLSQYVDCGTSYNGAKSLHLQGVDFTTTGVRWSAVAARSFSLDGASTLGYTVYVKTGTLHSLGTNEVACNTSFEVRATTWGVYPALVQFTDKGTILPGNIHYSAGTWNKVRVSLDMFSNTFNLQINDTDVGTFLADSTGSGNFLGLISGFALMSNHAGRECWFDQVSVESTTLVANGDFSDQLNGWSTVKVQTYQNPQGVEYPQFETLTGPPGGAAANCFPSTRSGNPFLSINVPFGADGYVEQTVTLPANGKPRLTFLSWGWEGYNSQYNYGGPVNANARIVEADGTVVSLEPSGFWTPLPMFTPSGPKDSATAVCIIGNQPKKMIYDLSAFSGHTVQLRLGATSSNCCGTNAFFDDVQITSAAFLTPTTVSVSADPSVVAEFASTPASPVRLKATVLDQGGDVMEGVNVSLTTTAGQLSSQSGMTDSDGEFVVSLQPPSLQTGTNPQSITVKAVAGPASNTIAVTVLPPGYFADSWTQSNKFNILETDVNLGQYLSISVTAYDWCIDLGWCKGSKVDLSQVPSIRVYFLTPTLSATGLTDFASALDYYFNVKVCSESGQTGCIQPNYAPVATLILEVPFVEAVKGFFDVDLNAPITINLPDYVTWLTASNVIKTTPSGYLDIAFTFSVNTNVQKLARDSLELVAKFGAIGLFHKHSWRTAASTILAGLKVLLDIGDVTVSLITKDLEQSGSLSSYVFFDFYHLQDVVYQLANIGGIGLKILNIIYFAVYPPRPPNPLLLDPGDPGGVIPSHATNLLADAREIVTSADLVVELLPSVPGLENLKNNDLFNWFKTGLNIVTTFIDPPNATIVPSYYDASHKLVLGYNPENDTITYASPSGILLPNGHGFVALLTENSTSPSSYTSVLNGLGTNALVPYEVQIVSYNQTAPPRLYSGILPGGSSVTVPAELNPSDGNLVPSVFLQPAVAAHVDGHSLTIVAKATLSNGTLTTASNGTLVIGGSHYDMVQRDPYTFEATTTYDASTPAGFSVYLFSPNLLGGFASGLTPFPPNSVATVSPTANSYGWDNADVTVALTGSNGRDSNGESSDTKEINYVLSGSQTGSATVLGNTASVTIYAEGNTTVSYYATDKAGNREGSHSLSLLIDKTRATITGSKSPPANAYDWNNVDVTVHFECSDTLSGVASATENQVVTIEGRGQVRTGVCTDKAGNSATTTVDDINIDRSPPVITSIQDGQIFILRQAVVADAQCTDPLSSTGETLSGVKTCILPTGPLDTSTVGPHSYVVTSSDYAGNSAVKVIHYEVHYNFTLVSPQPADTRFQVGRTMPVRFRLTDVQGIFVPSATAQIWVDSQTNPGISTGGANASNHFRYDPTENQYIFNLSMRGLVDGSHTLHITLDDGTVHIVKITLTS